MSVKMSKKDEDFKFFVGMLKEKAAEFMNICDNLSQIVEMDAERKPVAGGKRSKRLEDSKNKVRAYLAKVNAMEKGVQYQLMHETWMARNNQTGRLEVVTHEHDARLKMGSFDRKTDRYGASDPDEIVKAKIGEYILKTFKWFFDEKKQHRIDVVYPHQGACSVAVR
jgi:hypothetical protein